MSSSLVLDLKLENYEPYLKMITESIIMTSRNDGSLRKDMWTYLMGKYSLENIDYGQFLLAIRKFMNEGRMTNKNGFYSMHGEVISEFAKNPSANADDALKIIKEVQSMQKKGGGQSFGHKVSTSSKKSKSGGVNGFGKNDGDQSEGQVTR
jgi:hypothetical protein